MLSLTLYTKTLQCLEKIYVLFIKKCYAFLKFGNLCPKTYDMLDLL